MERKTELYEHQEISLAQIEERREKGFVHSSLYYLPQRENPGLWKKIFRNLQPERAVPGFDPGTEYEYHCGLERENR